MPVTARIAPPMGPANRPPPEAFSLRCHSVGSASRAEVEAFVQRVYAAKFGAQVRHFAPVLVGLHDAQGRLLAAAGYRKAQTGPLFLERYLDRPVQQLLYGADAHEGLRRSIVEVGHLAAERAGEGRRLIMMLGPLLASQGLEWVVSTLTQELRHLFVRLGVAPLALGLADPQDLGNDADDWGDYYQHHPVVLAGQIPLAVQRLAQRGAQA